MRNNVGTCVGLARKVFPASAVCLGLAACATSLPPTPTIVQENHAAGPTTRREWRHTPEQTPYRIELLGARSGRLLVGQARLWRQANGTWSIKSSGGQWVTVHGAGTDAASEPHRFTEGAATWTMRVTRESLPVSQPGVAFEAEPTLDLVLECAC